MPVPAMLTGRGLRGVVTERRDTVEVMVDVDMALVGREEPVPPGVTSPDRKPGDERFGSGLVKGREYEETVVIESPVQLIKIWGTPVNL